MKNISTMMDRKKNISLTIIKTLSKKTQVTYNWYGAYDMMDGSIHLGTDEKHTPTAIWHEIMHMVLFEQYSLEAAKMWDNIADEIQLYLFDQEPIKQPYIFTQPPTKAKAIDNGWVGNKNAGIRKQKEKSTVVGWKPTTQKRIPPRKFNQLPCQN